MIKILTVVGARPQFIKAAAISHVIKEKYAHLITEDILHTGQHYDDNMSGQFFSELDIPQPRYNLCVGSAPHGAQTAAMLKGIEEIILSNDYDGMIVYGDTNSTLAGALAGAKQHLPVYHIEAGLRSFNRKMPEEINRIVTDHLSTLLFAPTEKAMQNLHNEGFPEESIFLSGDVMLDNVLHYAPHSSFIGQHSPFILATLHRDFNTDRPECLTNILSALNSVGQTFNTEILLPVHPRTRQHIDSMDFKPDMTHIRTTAPLSYLQTLAALRQARLVLTDSGGLQKEAYFCGKPCVILRPETEWTEIVDAGAAILAGDNPATILDAAKKLWNSAPTPATSFGDGHAAEKIIDYFFKESRKL